MRTDARRRTAAVKQGQQESGWGRAAAVAPGGRRQAVRTDARRRTAAVAPGGRRQAVRTDTRGRAAALRTSGWARAAARERDRRGPPSRRSLRGPWRRDPGRIRNGAARAPAGSADAASSSPTRRRREHRAASAPGRPNRNGAARAPTQPAATGSSSPTGPRPGGPAGGTAGCRGSGRRPAAEAGPPGRRRLAGRRRGRGGDGALRPRRLRRTTRRAVASAPCPGRPGSERRAARRPRARRRRRRHPPAQRAQHRRGLLRPGPDPAAPRPHVRPPGHRPGRPAKQRARRRQNASRSVPARRWLRRRPRPPRRPGPSPGRTRPTTHHPGHPAQQRAQATGRRPPAHAGRPTRPRPRSPHHPRSRPRTRPTTHHPGHPAQQRVRGWGPSGGRPRRPARCCRPARRMPGGAAGRVRRCPGRCPHGRGRGRPGAGRRGVVESGRGALPCSCTPRFLVPGPLSSADRCALGRARYEAPSGHAYPYGWTGIPVQVIRPGAFRRRARHSTGSPGGNEHQSTSPGHLPVSSPYPAVILSGRLPS